MRLDEYFPPQRVAEMAVYMKSFAATFGVEDFRTRDRIPNTRRALALAEVARDEGRLHEFRNRAMEAHWRDAMNLEDDDDLLAIARDTGLSDDAVQRSKDDPQYLERIDAIREEAGRIGVEGIPTFVIGRMGLSGCQPYDVFVDFATQAGAKKRSQ
jgi:predicted DsbA family dithiol-disulfide isomerase